ncbi:tyrosine-type recombinase/integrase [Pseudomonas veronii]|uniref:tyrosine-type recombinase/integrase n=1 Tax=Pseudomonas veronii TaxID=76761 RepID=UPI002D76E8F2|nr:tyrosine-type recombinase/integrase [Pseudomonas veronii]WRU61293.1 tyrosine-type recombinase/integrase [Pseudomonas veronii]
MARKASSISQEDRDLLQDMLERDFQGDLQDAAEQEFERLLSETGGTLKQTASSLLSKLELYPDGDFPVSKYSMYKDPAWIIFKDKDGTATKVSFEELPPEVASIKKSFLYHLIPDYAPFANIRSYSTTKTHSANFRVVNQYVFLDNHITGDSQSLTFITSTMLNQALDRAKESSAFTHYYHLFHQIRFWMSLSAQQLIPVEHRLQVSANSVDTPERRKDVVNHFTGSLSTWVPFTEPELKKLTEYAFFWTDKAAPLILKARDFIIDNGLNRLPKKHLQTYIERPDIEKELNIEIDGIPIITLTKNAPQSADFWTYSWYRSFARSIDSVRNAIYILVALVTGLRASEISILKFDDITETKSGRFKLKVTRFKTSRDPNYKGDVSYIPLPRFVGKKVKQYEELRSVYGLEREGYLFQSNISSKKVNRQDSVRVENITGDLEEILGIDRIHTHRFRKTIAEILINRNERNIDIIRLLFGHHSYAMTLRYIGRNPYIVQSVAHAIEQNYIQDFTDIITAIKTSSSSGESARRLAQKITEKPGAFSGKQLRVTIFTYVSHLLSSGEPLFIYRTAVGSYCVSTELYSSPELPPCLARRNEVVSKSLPDPLYCDTACPHAVIIGKAARALEDNINFYKHMLENAGDTLSKQSVELLRRKVHDNSRHLETLKIGKPHDLIPAAEIRA